MLRTSELLFSRTVLCTLLLACAWGSPASAADYVIDTRGAHASIDFRFKHLNISWLTGEFKKFEGRFYHDGANPEASRIEVIINTASIDTNHAERDKHMRSDKYLHTDKYPVAKFVSTRIESKGDNAATVYGDLTLHGVTREIAIDATMTGAGNDPWGGYRVGFEGTVTLNTKEFGMEFPPTNQVELALYIEGIKQ